MKTKITSRLLISQKPKETPYQIHDTACVGFIYRMQPTGVASYYFMYRTPAGVRRKLLIGRADALTLTDARDKAEEYRSAVARGLDPQAEAAAQAAGELTLRRFIEEEWSPVYKATRKAHDIQLKRLLSGFRPLLEMPLASLTREDFERHRVNRMLKPLTDGEKLPSAATLNRCNATLRPVLELARKRGLIASNPLADVVKAREDRNSKIREMTPEEETGFLKVFADRRADRVAEIEAINARRVNRLPAVPRFLDYLEPMFLVSVDTGIRRGEAFSLTWADVDLKDRALNIPGDKTKSSQSRTIPLTTRAWSALSDWQAQSAAEGLVFPSRISGGPLGNIAGAWRALLSAAKVKGLRWHDLRHTFGTRCARRGVSIEVLRRLMGHSSIMTTQRYLHATADDGRAAIALLEGRN